MYYNWKTKLSAKLIYTVLCVIITEFSWAAVQRSVCSVFIAGTAATCETTAGDHLQADETRRSDHDCGHRSRNSRRMRCTRILRRRRSLHSLLQTTGRCRGHTCWTSCRSGCWVHLCRRYPSTQPPSAHSCMSLTVLWTYCTRRGTSCWCCSMTVTQTSAYSGRSASADWAVRCRASSCR